MTVTVSGIHRPKVDVRGSFPASRRPYNVSAIRLSEANRADVADWIKERGYHAYFHEDALYASRDPEYPSVFLCAFVGDYVVLDRGAISAMSHKSFWDRYYTP